MFMMYTETYTKNVNETIWSFTSKILIKHLEKNSWKMLIKH